MLAIETTTAVYRFVSITKSAWITAIIAMIPTLLGNVYVRSTGYIRRQWQRAASEIQNNYSNVSSDIEYPMLVSASSFAFIFYRRMPESLSQ